MKRVCVECLPLLDPLQSNKLVSETLADYVSVGLRPPGLFITTYPGILSGKVQVKSDIVPRDITPNIKEGFGEYIILIFA